MAEYIEREAAIDRLEKLFQLQATTARVIMEAIPTADVAPVRHGRWNEVKGFTGVEAFGYKEECVEGFACSVCSKEVDVSEGGFNYCPNCGAKMDKKE